tara:strand:- start:1540 stop:1734 length:195 start_codon:yes stop_codon:yes gene_type:complete
MFEFIGIFVVWFIGLAAFFYVPIVVGMIISDMTHNLGNAILGWWIASGCVILYLATTVAYFVVN